LGIPLVLIAGVWIGLQAVKQQNSSRPGSDPSQPANQVTNAKYQPEYNFNPQLPVSHEVVEAHADPPLAELGTERV
jgi:hypothetical protein